MLVVYIVVAVLSVAVCVLFAMIGELAARVLRPDELRMSGGAGKAARIDGINLGVDVTSMPPAIHPEPVGPVPIPADFGLIVLTTICTSCTEFALHFSGSPKAGKLPKPLLLLVSAPTPTQAEEFVVETGLRSIADLTVLFDQMGEWCHQTLGLNVAPSFIRVKDGRTIGAWSLSSFTDIPSLWEVGEPIPEAMATSH